MMSCPQQASSTGGQKSPSEFNVLIYLVNFQIGSEGLMLENVGQTTKLYIQSKLAAPTVATTKCCLHNVASVLTKCQSEGTSI